MEALAERRCIRTHDRNPDIFRAFLLHAMLLPLYRAASTAVVRRDDERRAATVLRHGLHGVPEFLYGLIHAMRAVEHEIVSSLVGPVVGLTVADEQYPRGCAAHVIKQSDLQKSVVDIFFIEARRGSEQLRQQRIL